MNDRNMVIFSNISLYLVVLLVLGGSSSVYGKTKDAQTLFECHVSTSENLIPSVGSMVGTHPVWIVDDSHNLWFGGDQPVKTMWVIAREHQGTSMVVTGRRLNGDGYLRFKSEVSSTLTTQLKINDVYTVLIVPGGANNETIYNYAFRGSFIIYPSPGCWEVLVKLGDIEARIVREIVEY